MIKRISLLLFLIISFVLLAHCLDTPYSAEKQLDINKASLYEIKQLPISEELAENIYQYLIYDSYFYSIYDLLKVKGMTVDIFYTIKDKIFIYIPEENDKFQRLQRIYFKIDDWKSDEGGSAAMVDEYIDFAREPFNINEVHEEKLLSIKNVSPIDAAAIVNYRIKGGLIKDSYRLRNIPGLQHYAYTNLRDFVRYSKAKEKNINYDYQIKITNNDPTDEMGTVFTEPYKTLATNSPDTTWYDILKYSKAIPEVSQKIKINYANKMKFGANIFNNYGDNTLIKRWKAYLSIQDIYSLSNYLTIHNLVLGHYRVGWGQGLVMNNTDYYSPRNTGFGYNSRLNGVIGDLSKSEEYALFGIATEFSIKNLYGILFYSNDDKDAIIDSLGYINNYIVLPGGIDNDILEKYGLSKMKNTVNEQTYGGFLKYKFYPGVYIGISGYESQYNRYWGQKRLSDLVTESGMRKIKKSDNEYTQGFYNYNGKYRRVLGLNAGVVFQNLTWSGEYSKLIDKGDAWYTSLAFIYPTFNVLVLARDYDIDYDNPYNRAYSEKERFNDTILEKPYYLKSPLYALLFEGSVQPQAERGVALSSRIQVSRNITFTKIFYDLYQLKSDGRWFSRFEGEIEYKIAFPFRVKYKKKIITGNLENEETDKRYKTDSNIVTLVYNLSSYDRLNFSYWFGHLNTPPLTKYPFRNESRVENNAIEGNIEHNFSINTKLSLKAAYWNGGGFYTFDGPFFDNLDGSGQKYAAEFSSRISDNMSVKFFYRITRTDNKERVIKDNNTIVNIYKSMKDINNTFYVQLDYIW